jgi:hypothetical protein
MVSILEQITLDIVATLQSVTVLNGYQNDLSVRRAMQREPVGGYPDRTAVVIQGQPTNDADATETVTGWIQPYTIDCYVVEAENSGVSRDTRINSIRADVEKALTLAKASQQRSGLSGKPLAIDTKLDDPELFLDGEGNYAGVGVQVNVQYWTALNDPYTSATSS